MTLERPYFIKESSLKEVREKYNRIIREKIYKVFEKCIYSCIIEDKKITDIKDKDKDDYAIEI